MDFRNNAAAQDSIGLRNNNPGNFRAGIDWKGAVGVSNGFVTFEDVKYGIRAQALNLYNNYYSGGKKTLIDFITKYSPETDNNNPASYANVVASEVGISPTDDMQLDRAKTAKIVRAMMNIELGRKYAVMVTDEDLQAGVDMIGKFQIMELQVEGIVKKNVLPIAVVGAVSVALTVYVYFVMKKNKS